MIPPRSTLWKGKKQLPFWVPIGYSKDVKSHQIKKVVIDGEPFAVYKSVNGTQIIYDKCPHQGASFAKGYIKDSSVVCPYHGFTFDNGKLTSFGTQDTRQEYAVCVPTLPSLERNDTIYALLTATTDTIESSLAPAPYSPPEEFNTSFTKLSGQMKINKNIDLVTENVLDMLHISYVHSFGNRKLPLPFKIKYEKLNDYSGRSTFLYSAGTNSISRQVANVETVIVENEFHLPSTTITRVISGDMIKTVLTRSLQVGPDETMLFWTIYRNFWNYDPVSKVLGDVFLRAMMEKTIIEDMNILKTVYEDRNTFFTKFDVTIKNFRKAKESFLKN
jgi:phenylpropionate dioxygenase-like ring-hydroxylating dioxygenase large terminal subunit